MEQLNNIYLDAKTATNNPMNARLRDAENDHNLLIDINSDLLKLMSKVSALDNDGALARPNLPNNVLNANKRDAEKTRSAEKMMGCNFSREKWATLPLVLDALDNIQYNLLEMHLNHVEYAVDKLDYLSEETA